MDKIIDSV